MFQSKNSSFLDTVLTWNGFFSNVGKWVGGYIDHSTPEECAHVLTQTFRETQMKAIDSQPWTACDRETMPSAATQGPKRAEGSVWKKDAMHACFNCLGYWPGG